MGQQLTKWYDYKALRQLEKPILLRIDDAKEYIESGDLILFRHPIINTNLRIEMDPLIARDISLIQQGFFPTKRMTNLSLWTSCGIAYCPPIEENLKKNIVVLQATEESIQVLPLEQCLVKCDRVAFRKIQHAKHQEFNQQLNEILHEMYITSPIQWDQILQQQQELIEKNNLQTVVNSWCQRTYTLCRHSISQLHAENLLQATIQEVKEQQQHKEEEEIEEILADGQRRKTRVVPLAQYTLVKKPTVAKMKELAVREKSEIDLKGFLSGAFVASFYEQLELLDPIQRKPMSTNSIPICPMAFWTQAKTDQRLVFRKDHAFLGKEFYIDIATLHINSKYEAEFNS